MEKQPISREGFDKIREDVRRMEEEEMPFIAEKIAEARAEGDLSENAEYHAQREAQGLLQAKINQLRTKLADSYIVDKSKLPKEKTGRQSRSPAPERDSGVRSRCHR